MRVAKGTELRSAQNTLATHWMTQPAADPTGVSRGDARSTRARSRPGTTCITPRIRPDTTCIQTRFITERDDSDRLLDVDARVDFEF